MARKANFYSDGYGLKPWAFMVVFIGSLVALGVGAVTIVYHIDSSACARTADRLGRPHEYDFWGDGCFVQLDGDDRFVPVDQYIYTEEQG